MKKILFGLLTIILSISGSAFVNTQKKNTNATYYYVMKQDQSTYKRFGTTAPDEDMCYTVGFKNCVIGFSNDKGPTVDPTFLPPTVYTSQMNGYYVED
ncbi:hypothetical protein B0O44_10117 [Pedobacter nutrimenti]|uniref:GLPGLI family protein n=1 Tax=Pedobacter nutrimenti TaxID=1241337 RepID=A0A318UJC3_9SPHI|nr:hypothetical protein B0O44_10117 [Pedobacter nutrimenti]